MKYTKQERHKMYVEIYNGDEFNQCKYGHLCCELERVAGYEIETGETLDFFPEIHDMFPVDYDGDVLEHYDPNEDGSPADTVKEIRKTILEFCIEMTKP